MKFCEVSTLQRKISLKTALIGAVSMKFREVSTLLQTPPNIFTLAVLKFQLSGVAGSGYKDSSCSQHRRSCRARRGELLAGGEPAANYCSDRLIIVQLVYIESLCFCITLQWCHTVILSYDTIICLVFALYIYNLHLRITQYFWLQLGGEYCMFTAVGSCSRTAGHWAEPEPSIFIMDTHTHPHNVVVA